MELMIGVHSICLSLSFADVSFHGVLALLAGDIAAPVIAAVAAFLHLLSVSVVAAATAHQPTAAAAAGCLIALPVVRQDRLMIILSPHAQADHK